MLVVITSSTATAIRQLSKVRIGTPLLWAWEPDRVPMIRRGLFLVFRSCCVAGIQHQLLELGLQLGLAVIANPLSGFITAVDAHKVLLCRSGVEVHL